MAIRSNEKLQLAYYKRLISIFLVLASRLQDKPALKTIARGYAGLYFVTGFRGSDAIPRPLRLDRFHCYSVPLILN